MTDMDVATGPRWDGRRIHFDIDVSGSAVPCAISSAALREMSGQSRYSPADLVRCFNENRLRIEAIARRRAGDGKASITGIISIWEDDVDAPTPTSAPTRTPARAPPA